ncbi:alpha-2-macroglobulin [bacterium]
MRKTILACMSVLLFGLFIIVSCSKKQDFQQDKASPEQLQISAHTSGEISTTSHIRIQFAKPMVKQFEIDNSLKQSPMEFNPSIQGKAIWINSKTLEYRPNKELPAGQSYKAIVSIPMTGDTLFPIRQYEFSFSTIKQAFEIHLGGLKTTSVNQPEKQELSGTVKTADIVPLSKISHLVEAWQQGKKLQISWSQSDDKKTHSFVIKNIQRTDKPSSIRVEWNGRVIGVDEKSGDTLKIPAFSKFEVTKVNAVQQLESYVEINFSDPLDKNQNLDGLIWIENQSDLRFTIENNTVRVYSSSRWAQETRVHIETGIRNQQGASLNKPRMTEVVFKTMLPEVRFAGEGVIIPTSQGLTIPIETANLQAVMVKATRIFDQNMAQFFQVNDYDGDQELYRVGHVVWKDIVDLELPPQKVNHWVRYGLDARPLIENHKAGLYRLDLTFLMPHIVYDCEEPSADHMESVQRFLEAWTNEQEKETSYWNYWDDQYNYNEYYRNRKNPCHPAFYQDYYDHKITVSRNILISDIGLIAKKGSNDSVLVVATDIKTAEPLKDVQLTLLDFQQQLITEGRTNNDGMVFLLADKEPFLITAQHKDQVGYLKMKDGSALSVSHFDVGGAKIKRGIKGFFYGERGVWRPGDNIYLTFVLLDESGQFPKDHPVKFELRDPRGRQVEIRTITDSHNGFYAFHTNTDADAPTGNWKARAIIGGTTFEKVLKIETIMSNRLKMQIDFGEDVTSIKEGLLSATLKSEWLHGAPASLLKADMELGFQSQKTAFKTYSDYIFDDPARTYQPESHFIFDGKLDQQGETLINTEIEAKNVAPGMLTAHLKTRVFEPGGAFSVDRFSIPYHPYKQYVGITAPKGDKARGMLLTDTTHAVQMVLLDTEGKPVSSGKVEVELYKIRWRWWWEKGSESIADYLGRQSYRPIQKGTVTIVDGKGTWDLKIKYPDWGRYLIRAYDVDGGHTTGLIKYIDWPGWAGRAQKDNAGGANVLAFTTDKTEYEVGEKAILNIPTGESGRVLLTIESGSRILQAEWLEAQKDGIQYSLKIKPSMAPNVYAHVTLLQPHLKAGNDLPIRMYGVTPIKVTDPKTRLKPVIETKDVFEPMSNPTVTVREANGRPMTYTLAVVDEGLLGLTRYSTPNPWNHFYRKEALGIQTWDFYDQVTGAFAGQLERLLAIGGGDEGEKKGQQRANRFPPMVRFYGPFELNKGKKAKHGIDIPQYIGAVRVMVVGGDRKAFGAADKSIQVKKPLMLLGTLPRVLSVGETVDLPITVFALDKNIKDVKVSVSVTGPITLIGDLEKQVRFPNIGDQLVNFKIQTEMQTGIARVNMTAVSGKERISQSIEMDVRIPSSRITQVIDTLLLSDDIWERYVVLPGLSGTNNALLELSRIPPIDLEKRLKFLIRYPHGCIEQTTSSVFPQLYLSHLLDLNANQKDEIQANITAGIERLIKFQTYDGGFGYWPGNADSQPWGSNYAGHFLIEAEHLGYHVPAEVMKQWRKYQKKQAQHWADTRKRADLMQAYRLYTLALSGHPELSAMNRLKERDNLSVTARYRLAAAYELSGQKEAAQLLSRGSINVEDYQELSFTYGSSVRDKAMILETLVLMQELDETVDLVKEISEALSEKKWMNTQTTAYALLALGKYIKLAPPSEAIDILWSWNGSQETRATSSKPILQIPLSIKNESEASLTIKNRGKGSLYPSIIMNGLPEPGQETAAEQGLQVNVNYMTLDEGPLSIDNLEQGTDFFAKVTITNTGHRGQYDEIALSHLIPSGWEIHNERMDPIIRGKQAAFDYQDIRDDRVYTYFDIDHKKSKSFKVLLTAAYLGKFYLPPVVCEAMYDATIHGRVKGRWINVVPAD